MVSAPAGFTDLLTSPSSSDWVRPKSRQQLIVTSMIDARGDFLILFLDVYYTLKRKSINGQALRVSFYLVCKLDFVADFG